MVDKLHEYQGLVGRLHTLRTRASARWCAWRESRCQQQEGYGGRNFPLGLFSRKPPKQEQPVQQNDFLEEYTHIYRSKTRAQLVRISAAVMGIEFSYAAETAFVSPILLKIGLKHEHMTLVWGLSPIVGFFITPLLGSLSDRCHMAWEDHARGLSTFTIMAGLGGFLGYALGAINWDVTALEVPLRVLEQFEFEDQKTRVEDGNEEGKFADDSAATYGTVATTETQQNLEVGNEDPSERPSATLVQYLASIIYMPGSLRILCLTNLFCWSAHVCYSLYFTDFVGEAVFKGNPEADVGTYERDRYEEGVRFGCWGMSMYSLSCAFYSLIIERLIKRFRARNVYVCGLLVDGLGMLMLAFTKHHVAVIVFSAAAGIMYSTLFTMPYLLVAHYHETGVFSVTNEGEAKQETQLRGLGTDVAIVSSMVFLAQFTLSMCMGLLVSYFETTTTVVCVSAVLCLCGAISATQVMYLDL
ncbi:hypothetical protein C0J52_17172 [Blattella germanica]|nr:hypothetical protein C0J52_17172 [Blattella germanica]